MAPQTEFLDVLLNTVEANCSLGTVISLKELGANEGIYVELGQGSTDTVYYNKQMIKVIPAMFMSRHKSQKQCMDWLCSICDYLQRLKIYPHGETFAWLDTAVVEEPSKTGRDEDGTYRYSCLLNCKIYF